MFEVVEKRILAPKVVRMEVAAPRIAKKRRPGQFVIVRVDEVGERIPLTIVDSDPARGTIVLVIQEMGYSTALINRLEVGQALHDVVGPLGRPTEIESHGRVACIGGGVGVAPLYPIAKGFNEAGNELVTIIGARSQDLIILEEEMASVSDELWLATDDGSRGLKGFVSELLRQRILDGQRIDFAVAVGPVLMMKACCEVTREFSIPTMVSLNPIMIDGTGMCGGCRVSIGGQMRFACVDGPEFDGHQVDFDELMERLRAYAPFERQIYEQLLHQEKECALITANDK